MPSSKPRKNELVKTKELINTLITAYPEYRKYTQKDFLTLLDKISRVESLDSNVRQLEGGPGRGYYQMELTSAPTAKQRALNINKNLREQNLPTLTLPNYNQDFTKLTKDEQAFYTLSKMVGAAEAKRAKGKTDTYINPYDAQKTWLDLHWAGAKKDRPERIQHWETRLGPAEKHSAPQFYSNALNIPMYTTKKDEFIWDKPKGELDVLLHGRPGPTVRRATAMQNAAAIKGQPVLPKLMPTYAQGGEVKNNKYSSIPRTGLRYPNIVRLPVGQRSFYDPVEETIYLADGEDPTVVQHEMFHHWQKLNNNLSVGPVNKPPIMSADPGSFYNRRQADIEDASSKFFKKNPSFLNIPFDLVYNKEVDPAMYYYPEYVEGEAEEYQNYINEGGEPVFPSYAKGGLIKRADGSYSRRGLWDNIRANRGSGRRPTKEMLRQERKIRAAEKKEDGSWIEIIKGSYVNPFNWGVPDYSNVKNFSKAYEQAKKAGEEEFLWNGKRYNTKYAGTPRQEVGAYGVQGKPVHPMDLNDPAQVNLYPPFGKYLPGHIAASIGDNQTSVDYRPKGNIPYGLDKVKNKGEKSFNVYGQDNLTFSNKAASLPTGDYMLEDEYRPSDWNLFTNNCADNVCDAFGIPRSKGIQTPKGAMQKIQEKYPTLDVTGRTYEDYYYLALETRYIANMGTPAERKKLLTNYNNLIGIASSPDLQSTEVGKTLQVALQVALSKEGYDLSNSIKSNGNFDGVIGPETLNALKDWQSKNTVSKKEDGGPVYNWIPEYPRVGARYEQGGWLDEYDNGGTIEDQRIPTPAQYEFGLKYADNNTPMMTANQMGTRRSTLPDGKIVDATPEILAYSKGGPTNNGKRTITKREDFEPWWNWASVQAAGGNRRQEAYGSLGDLYAYYAGQPLKHSVLEYSQYKPTNAKNPKATYISINDAKFKQEVIDNYNRVFNEKKLLPDETQVNNNTYAVSGYTRPRKEQMKRSKSGELYYEKGKDHVSNAIGRYYLSKGKDNKGEYISYYDIFDVGTGSDGGGIGETLGLTKPFEIYDRIYLDPKTGKPKLQNGGPVKYAHGATVFTKQTTPAWVAGTPTPTTTQREIAFNRSFSPGTAVPYPEVRIPASAYTPASPPVLQGYNPYKGPMRLHAPDTLRIGKVKKAEHGGFVEEDQLQNTNPILSNIYKKYPAFKNLGPVTLKADPSFVKDKTGVGEIEYFSPIQDTVRYSTGYNYPHPNFGTHGIVYNPNINNAEEAIRLDLLHGMPISDKVYAKHRQEFGEAFKKANQGDIDYWWSKEKEKYGEGDGKEAFEQNYIDGVIRGLMLKGDLNKMGYSTEANEFYLQNPEINKRTKQIENYLQIGQGYMLPEVEIIANKHEHGSYVTNNYKKRAGIPYAISPGVSNAGMYVGPTTQRGITFKNGGWLDNL